MNSLTVIIPVYNSRDIIQDCINHLTTSLSRIQVKYKIIIVVNDQLNYDFISSTIIHIIYNHFNLGYGKSVNRALNNTDSNWILIINPDVFIATDTLSSMWKYAISNKYAIIAPRLNNSDGSLQFTILPDFNIKNILLQEFYCYKLFRHLIHHPYTDSLQYIDTHLVNGVSGAIFLIKTKILTRLGGFDEKMVLYFEDFDLCIRVRSLNQSILFITTLKPVIHFLHHGSSGEVDPFYYIKSLKVFCEKYHSKLYTVIILIIIFLGTFGRAVYWRIRRLLKLPIHMKDSKKEDLNRMLSKYLLRELYSF